MGARREASKGDREEMVRKVEEELGKQKKIDVCQSPFGGIM